MKMHRLTNSSGGKGSRYILVRIDKLGKDPVYTITKDFSDIYRGYSEPGTKYYWCYLDEVDFELPKEDNIVYIGDYVTWDGFPEEYYRIAGESLDGLVILEYNGSVYPCKMKHIRYNSRSVTKLERRTRDI